MRGPDILSPLLAGDLYSDRCHHLPPRSARGERLGELPSRVACSGYSGCGVCEGIFPPDQPGCGLCRWWPRPVHWRHRPDCLAVSPKKDPGRRRQRGQRRRPVGNRLAGTKPLASFIDGWLGSHISIVATSMILSAPAVVIALFALQRLKEDRPGVNGRLSEWLRLLVLPGAGFLPSVSPEPGSPSSDRLEPTFSLGRRHYRRKHFESKATREPAHGQRAADSGQAPAAGGISEHYRDARDSRNQPGPLRQGERQDSTSSNVVTQDAIAQAS